MSKLIVQQIPDETVNGRRSTIQQYNTTLEPYKVNLTEEQKQKSRTMAAGREGYARMVSQIANSHINSLPREHTPTELTVKLNYDSKLEELRQSLMTLLEIVSDTQLANGIDAMKLTDDYAAALQISRNNNGPLDLAMREVDEWNARFANAGNSNTGTQP